MTLPKYRVVSFPKNFGAQILRSFAEDGIAVTLTKRGDLVGFHRDGSREIITKESLRKRLPTQAAAGINQLRLLLSAGPGLQRVVIPRGANIDEAIAKISERAR
jgi:hypothetical protein